MFASKKVNTLPKECEGNVSKGSSTNGLSAGKQLTFVCISDTHCKLDRTHAGLIPPGDVLLHTGDFTMDGSVRELIDFNNFLGALPHTYKVVIAGNHEDCLAMDWSQHKHTFINHYKTKYGITKLCQLLTNCIYLEDELTEICGIKIYGSPWTPLYSTCDAFSLSGNEQLQKKWDKIPADVDILMTHGPPRGFGDMTKRGVEAGCSNLLRTVQMRVKPRYHVYGHIHEGYGVYNDGTTVFINASICTKNYKPINRPVKFHMNIPEFVCDTEHAKAHSELIKKCDKSAYDYSDSVIKCTEV